MPGPRVQPMPAQHSQPRFCPICGSERYNPVCMTCRRTDRANSRGPKLPPMQGLTWFVQLLSLFRW